ncbi:MAG: hypothetical protein AB1758_18490, partial [Candidatus Eremiobacterota bacterium]
RAERDRFLELMQQGDPRLLEPEYDADQVLSDGRWTVATPAMALAALVPELAGQPVTVAGLFQEVTRRFPGLAARSCEFLRVLGLHTINGPERLEDAVWRERPLFKRVPVGRARAFRLVVLTEAETSTFHELLARDDPALQQPEFDADQVLGGRTVSVTIEQALEQVADEVARLGRPVKRRDLEDAIAGIRGAAPSLPMISGALRKLCINTKGRLEDPEAGWLTNPLYYRMDWVSGREASYRALTPAQRARFEAARSQEDPRIWAPDYPAEEVVGPP